MLSYLGMTGENMRIAEFKKIAENIGAVYDNKDKAHNAWVKSWGFEYWRDCWAYKEFRVLNMTYRTGRVYRRHGSYTHTEYLINNEVVEVSTWRTFMRKLVAA